MIQILFDIDMPESCAECPFMVHCDDCESWENRCPILGKRIGYDYNEPYTPKDHRQEDCPLKEVQTVERPHGEWEHWGSPFSDDSIANSIVCSLCKARYVEIEGEVFNFCPNCGASMQANDRQVTGKLDENTQKHYGFRKKY